MGHPPRIAALPGVTQVGQVIFIRRQNRRARCKVARIGKPNTSHAGQIGFESMEPSNVIWETEIKSRLKQL